MLVARLYSCHKMVSVRVSCLPILVKINEMLKRVLHNRLLSFVDLLAQMARR